MDASVFGGTRPHGVTHIGVRLVAGTCIRRILLVFRCATMHCFVGSSGPSGPGQRAMNVGYDMSTSAIGDVEMVALSVAHDTVQVVTLPIKHCCIRSTFPRRRTPSRTWAASALLLLMQRQTPRRRCRPGWWLTRSPLTLTRTRARCPDRTP